MQFEAGEFTAGSKTPLCFSIMTDTDTPSPYVFAGKDGGTGTGITTPGGMMPENAVT